MIAYKNHKHSVNNPYAQLQKEIPLSVRLLLFTIILAYQCLVKC